jgi:dTDP-4-amino-4,6-dideoxy-D-galactose acyltransferase
MRFARQLFAMMPPESTAPPCQFLEWDSQFFARRIGRVLARQLSATLVADIEGWCRAHRIDCLYLLADPNHYETSVVAAEHGFQLVDVRITMEASLKIPAALLAEAPADGIRTGRPDDLPLLRQTARRLHTDSRFFFDGRFDRNRSERMFEIWLEKSFADEMGRVFVAEWQGQPAGYIACRRPNAGTGQIDLLGVDERAQGKRLGQKLLSAALRWFAAQQVVSVMLVTQGRNCRAQRLYQRSGFVTRSQDLWYHRWFPGETGASSAGT